jgi:hypothetical protein
MNTFVLQNTFIKVYICYFLIHIFIKTRSQSCTLETVSLAILNDLIYGYGGSTFDSVLLLNF